MAAPPAKQTRGRQKIEMVKMDNENSLQVTFSKRRFGLFKKASELCTLCAADVALIVFSPGDKAYTFGNPSVESVLTRFLNGDVPPNPNPNINPETIQIMEARRDETLAELNNRLTTLTEEVEAEKKRSRELKELTRVTQLQCQWKPSIEEMSQPELMELRASLLDLKKKVAEQAERMIAEANLANPPPLPPMLYPDGAVGAGPSEPAVNVNDGIGGGPGGEMNVPQFPSDYPYGQGFY